MKTIIWQRNDVVVDRENESDDIINLLNENIDKNVVHFICSPTAIGKTSLITKVIEKYESSERDVIRIKTKPCNKTNGKDSWYYLGELFDGISAYYDKMADVNGYALTFSNYLDEHLDKISNEKRLSSGLEALFGSDSKKGIFKNLIYLILKKILKLDEYSVNGTLNDDSLTAILTKKNYISYVLNTRSVLLIADNFQNIDDLSLECFDEWLQGTSNPKNYFIFEYTLNEDSNRFREIRNYLEIYAENIIRTDLQPLKKEYVIDIIHRNVKNLSDDLAFNLNVVNHYQDISMGNIRELIDYSTTYEEENITNAIVDNENGTYRMLKSITNSGSLFLLISIIYHQGNLHIKHARAVFPKELNFENSINDLITKNLIERTEDSIKIKHASIIDQWQQHITEFSSMNAVVYNRLKNYYLGYLDSTQITERNEAWLQLLHLYSNQEPCEIKNLLPQLQEQIIVSISPEDSWKYIRQVFLSIQDDIETNKKIFFRLLEICYKLELYAEGYEILTYMESTSLFDSSNLLFLHKLLYLSALDQHELVIELFENRKTDLDLISRFGLNIMIACFSSYRYIGRMEECINIHKKILKTVEYKKYDEYAIFLRLTNIYLTNKKALKYVKKSIKILHDKDNRYQEGKSRITYAKLLAGLGKNNRALKELKKAEKLLKNYPIRGNVLWIDEADILLTQGIHDNYVWNLLQKSEFTAVTPYDRLTIVVVKLAWCYENNEFEKAYSLIERGKQLISLEPDFHLHTLFYYNSYIILQKAGERERSSFFYNKAYALKNHSRYIRARIEGPKTIEEKNRIKHPWYICYLSFWNHDIENMDE